MPIQLPVQTFLLEKLSKKFTTRNDLILSDLND